MSLGFGTQKSKSSSNSVDLTPPEFTNLRDPVASALLNLFQTGGPVYTGSSDLLGASMPVIANPAYTALQNQIRTLQTAPAAPAARPSPAAGGLPSGALNDRGAGIGGRRRRGSGPTTPATSGGATIDQLVAQLGQTQQFINNPQFAGQAPLVAPLTEQQKSLIDQIVASVQQPNALMGAGKDQLMSTLRGDYLNPSSNPFLAATIEAAQRPVIDAFNRTTVPNLLSRFVAAGQQPYGAGSSAFAHEANTAANDFTRNLGDISTNIAGENYQQERTRQAEAVTTANTVTNDELTRMVTSLQQAALPQLVQDLGIQRGLAEFQRRVGVIMDALKLAGGLAAPTTGQNSSSSSSGINVSGGIGGSSSSTPPPAV